MIGPTDLLHPSPAPHFKTFHIQKRIQFSKLDLFPSASGMVSKYSVGPTAEKSFLCQSQLIRYPHISEGGSGFSFENIMFFLNILQWRKSRYLANLNIIIHSHV